MAIRDRGALTTIRPMRPPFDIIVWRSDRGVSDCHPDGCGLTLIITKVSITAVLPGAPDAQLSRLLGR
jgi:hypothetical protein